MEGDVVNLQSFREAKVRGEDPRLEELEEWVQENPESVALRMRELEILLEMAVDALASDDDDYCDLTRDLVHECLEDM